MKMMLFKDYIARVSAMDAVAHVWIQTYAVESEDKIAIKTSLAMFRNYINKGPL